MSYPIAELLAHVEPRRRFSVEQKLAAWRQRRPGGRICRRWRAGTGWCRPQVYRWRPPSLAELGVIGVPGAPELPSFVAVEITKDIPSLPASVPKGKSTAVDDAPRRPAVRESGADRDRPGGRARFASTATLTPRCWSECRRAVAAMIPVPSGCECGWRSAGPTCARHERAGAASPAGVGARPACRRSLRL
jgi:hypothetical protein